jgi:hypothetical protein
MYGLFNECKFLTIEEKKKKEIKKILKLSHDKIDIVKITAITNQEY